MKVRYSEKKEIPIVEFGNDTEVNMTGEDPVKWIMFSAKVKSTSGYIETHKQLVDVTAGRLQIEIPIKRKINKKDLKKFTNLVKEHIKNGKLSKSSMLSMVKKI